MKGTIYGNRLPRGTQVGKGVGTAVLEDRRVEKSCSEIQDVPLTLWKPNIHYHVYSKTETSSLYH